MSDVKSENIPNGDIIESHHRAMDMWVQALVAKRSGDDATYTHIHAGDILVSAANIGMTLEDYENALKLIQYAIMRMTPMMTIKLTTNQNWENA